MAGANWRAPTRAGRWWSRQRRRVTSWLQGVPALGTVTATGWAAVGAVVVTGVVGWALGWIEFRSFAVLVALLLAIAIPFVLAGSQHAASLTLASGRVRVGDQGQGRIALRSPSGRRVSAQRIELPVGSAVASFRAESLRDTDEVEQLFAIAATRRGVIPVGPAAAIRSDPVGLLQRRRVLTEQLELFVHPRVVVVDSLSLGFLRDIEGVTTKNLSSSDVSFHGLRDYAPGDDRRSVHWRSTARTGRLMVRQFTETMRAHLLLLLSTRPADYASADDFELAVSVAASIGVGALRQERRVSLATSTRMVHAHTPGGLLDELCRVEVEPDAPEMSGAVAEAIRRVPAASVAALVAGSRLTAAELSAGQLRLTPDVACFGVRCGDGLTLDRRRVGKVTVLDLGSLDDLGRGLRGIS